MIRVDYTGRKFGELTVIELAEDEPGKPKKWKCLCSCGNIAIVQSNNLKTEKTKSCGCLKIKPTSLDGQKFGRLTVIKRGENYSDGTTSQICLCDCGKQIRVRSRALLTGNTKSCGCLLSDSSRERASNQRWNNEYIKDTLPFKKKISSIRVMMIQRCVNPNNKNYKEYGERGISVCDEWLDKENGAKNFYEWAINSGYADGLTIDRINNDGNYEPSNCRWTDRTTQGHNQRIRKDNISGHKGVSYDKTRKKWKAFLYHKNKLVGIEYFETKEQAIEYRKELEKRIEKDC